MSTATQQPRPAYRTPLGVRRALLGLASIFAVLMVIYGAITLLELAARHTTTAVTSYRDVDRLVIEDTSDVQLRSAPAGSALEVRARITESLGSPDRSAERDGGTLRLASSCTIVFAGSCGVDYDISVPAGTAVRVETSGGDIRAKELRSSEPITLSTSAGDIIVAGATTPELLMRTSGGDVSGAGIRAGNVIADSSAGDVRLSLAGLAELVDATTSAGDVGIVVPDAVYRLDTDTSAGDTSAGQIRTSPDAPRTIRAVTSAGDIRIEARR